MNFFCVNISANKNIAYRVIKLKIITLIKFWGQK